MARSRSRYVCQECGSVHTQWAGECDAAGGGTGVVEEGAAEGPPKSLAGGGAKGRRIEFVGLQGSSEMAPRRLTGIAEFDRVCGGGLVPGSALLLGGDPGIGKSTLILQALGEYARQGGHAVYISGEEAMAQVRMRGARMDLSSVPLHLGAATNVEDIL